MNEIRILRNVRLLLALFVISLVISGATAIPLRAELSLLDRLAGEGTLLARLWPSLGMWISRVHDALQESDAKYPFLALATIGWPSGTLQLPSSFSVHFGIRAETCGLSKQV